ncbi:MAG TPA: nucleoside-diphosphate sugar epimerase/dehydratase [Gammaproteobacteria bacterium]|nr:nucleoside-diphosphate sugar epimerase/dehydratase [Gammaproteobacteria bacterium]
MLRSRWTVFLHDLLWIPLAVLLAYWIRFNLTPIPRMYFSGMTLIVGLAVPFHALSFWLFGCYRGIWRYASIPDLVRILKAVGLGAIATFLGAFLFQRLEGVPRSVLVLYPILLGLGLGGSRLLYRIFKDRWISLGDASAERALVVGAGRAGELLIRDLRRHGPFLPVALVDDDPGKQGHEVQGVRVRGRLSDIARLVRAYDIQIVLIAMPSASRKTMDKVVQVCNEVQVPCRTLPGLSELADGRVEVSRLRPVTVEDLLGRDPVVLDSHAISEFLRGKRVLVTGGGGSIGAELCRQISRHEPALLAILDNSEYNLYLIDQELAANAPQMVFSSALGSVQDESAVENLFAQVKPEVIFHAAAYKHVPIVEDNVVEGIRNNIFGTRVVADAALRHGVDKFVLISTDKTVNPTNVMGTTKRVAELYCQALNREEGTHFITTRFGNVLASCGSVVPLFERQIAAGGPVTVTDPDITRYFMTIHEAASLILQAGAIGRGGEIFVLDMGEPVRIRDLAEKLIQLSGLRPYQDIQIVYTGLRPGEKMHEELFYTREELQGTTHPKLLLANSIPAALTWMQADLGMLYEAVGKGDVDRAKGLLCSLVPEFTPQAETGSDRQPARAVLRLVKT